MASFTEQLQDTFFGGLRDVASAGADRLRGDVEREGRTNNAPPDRDTTRNNQQMLTFGLIGVGAVVLLLVLTRRN